MFCSLEVKLVLLVFLQIPHFLDYNKLNITKKLKLTSCMKWTNNLCISTTNDAEF